VVAHRHQGVLELGALGGVGVDVAGGHAGQAQPVGQGLKRPVACPVGSQVGALKLDAQVRGTEGVAQA